MAKFYSQLDPRLTEFIQQQAVFFVASAPLEGRVNLSPKGMDTLRVLDEHSVAYLDLTGSGNETSAHIGENQRLTMMFCSFDAKPLILRLYGRGEVHYPGDAGWNERIARFDVLAGARQLIVLQIDSLQTSCGFAVPRYQFEGHRDQLIRWADKKGPAGLDEYRRQNNALSIDGLPTGIDGRLEDKT